MKTTVRLGRAAGALLVLVGCAGGSPQARLALPQNGTARMLALGDSYTIGEGVAPAERWPVQLAERLRARGVAIASPRIIARTGWTCRALAAAIASERPRGPFELVTLAIGVNDQFGGGEAERYRGEFASLLATAIGLAGGRAERVLVLSIPDWGVTPFAAGREPRRIATEIEAFNAVNRAETKRAGAVYVDVTELSRERGGEAGMLAADGLHPSGRLYAVWAEHAMRPALDALTSPAK